MNEPDQDTPLGSIPTLQLTAADLRPVDFNQPRMLTDESNMPTLPFILLKDGCGNESVHALEHLYPEPRRMRGQVVLQAPLDFIAYVARYITGGTQLFFTSNTAGAQFTAVMNGQQDQDNRGWHDHIVTYATDTSRQWKTWKENNGKQMNQAAFAEFIEANRLDFTSPEAADLLKIAETMDATQTAAFKGMVRQANGDTKLAFESTSKATAGERGELTVPDKFAIAIPVFVDDKPYAIEAHFRYRINTETGRLTISYQLINPEYTFEFVTDKLVETIRTGIGQPIYRGKPITNIPAIS